MSEKPLMPKATAVWLVENTALTFKQIGDFCGLHELEVKGIADGEVAQGIKGLDPIATGQLTREEIERGEKDPNYRLKLARPKVDVPISRVRKGPKYTPLSRRQDKPDAIMWLLRNHPELSDSQIMKLVGTTKPTIEAIRNRTHWNIANIKPRDPVTLGICTQIELDEAVRKAAERLARQRKKQGLPEKPEDSETLKSPEESLGLTRTTPASGEATETAEAVFGKSEEKPAAASEEDVPDAEAVFAGLKGRKSEED
ncbi:DUF1013 domain-containing protein [Thermopetrobacter sp. TC1]|uniref:DUF1013 domain-containing protein n=1 Tax=Thermopetrobacter sp. TC1 TaxID=1495045 RepID=UPI0005704F31|nr:cell cycle transcriptional regulator TrcR [Thermopetrobacter sp. TC1]